MTDRVYPNSAKPTPTTNPPTAFPATKAQLYNASRPAYRPQPSSRRRSRCCSCCLWTTFTIALLIFLVAIAGGILYLLYHPQWPTFRVTNLQISQFNLTSSSHLATNISLSLLARNPNKKITFVYNPTSVLVTAGGVNAGSGTFPEFTLATKNTTILKTVITTSSQVDDATTLKSDLKKKKSFAMKVEMNTKVKVKIGGMKTKKVRVRVTCDGIKGTAPSGKSPAMATTSGAKCEVDLRVKIWKWTF